MEWTAQMIREVEFREKLRGYHPDDVDAFVEQVAAAFEQLEEAPVAAPAEDALSEDTIRKTLLMAQRTADLVQSEAEESAARLLSDARNEAEALVAEANRLADDVHREAHRRLTAQIGELEGTRGQLQQDVDALHEYVDRQRRRLRELLVEQLQILDEAQPVLPEAPQPLAGASAVEPAVQDDEADAQDDEAPAQDSEAHAEVADVDVLSRAPHLPSEGEDDPFLAELRRAVDDPSRPGPAHEDVAEGQAGAGQGEAAPTDDAGAYDALGSDGNRLSGRLFRRH